MSWDLYTRAILTLLIVLGLIMVLSVLLRRYGSRFTARGSRRLGIVEATSLDTRRRLVLVRRDGVEHLLLLGPNGDIVLESGIRTEAFAQHLADPTP